MLPEVEMEPIDLLGAHLEDAARKMKSTPESAAKWLLDLNSNGYDTLESLFEDDEQLMRSTFVSLSIPARVYNHLVQCRNPANNASIAIERKTLQLEKKGPNPQKRAWWENPNEHYIIDNDTEFEV
jgi:hypothetical protein